MKKSLFASVVLLVLVVGCAGSDLPPEPTSASFGAPIGDATRIFEGFGPPYDVYNNNELIMFTNPTEIVLVESDQHTLEIYAQQDGGYIYNTGFIYLNDQWVPYKFPQDTVGDSSWIANEAHASLPLFSSDLAVGNNYVVAYSCKEYDNEWKCGCEDVTSGSCNQWMLQSFVTRTVELPPEPADPDQLITALAQLYPQQRIVASFDSTIQAYIESDAHIDLSEYGTSFTVTTPNGLEKIPFDYSYDSSCYDCDYSWCDRPRRCTASILSPYATDVVGNYTIDLSTSPATTAVEVGTLTINPTLINENLLKSINGHETQARDGYRSRFGDKIFFYGYYEELGSGLTRLAVVTTYASEDDARDVYERSTFLETVVVTIGGQEYEMQFETYGQTAFYARHRWLAGNRIVSVSSQVTSLDDATPETLSDALVAFFDFHPARPLVPDVPDPIEEGSSDNWTVQRTTDLFEISENLEPGNINRETIAHITDGSFIDEAELPVLLSRGTIEKVGENAAYTQQLYFEDRSSGFVQFDESDQDVASDFLYFPDGRQIARYEVEFTSSLDSSIVTENGTPSPTGDRLTDLEEVNIHMLDKTYTIVEATRNGARQGQLHMTLLSGDVRDSLLEGTTRMYTIDQKNFEVTLEFVSATQGRFTVNGESTPLLQDGQITALSDGTRLAVSSVLFQDYPGGVHAVEFFLGADKTEFIDTNVNDTGASDNLRVNDEEIRDARVAIRGEDDNQNFYITHISVNMSAPDDMYVPVNGALSRNPELTRKALLFGQSWDVFYKGLTKVPSNSITITPRGVSQYDLGFVDGGRNEVEVGIAYTNGNSFEIGDIDDRLHFQEAHIIGIDEYFFVSDEQDQDGERKSFVLRYKRSDAVNDDNPEISFDIEGSADQAVDIVTVGTAQDVVVDGGRQATVAEMAQIRVGGGTFRVYNASSIKNDDWRIYVDMNGDGQLSDTVVGLNTQHGARIQLDNNTDGTLKVTITTPNDDDYEDLKPNAIVYNIGHNAGEVQLSRHPDDIFSYTAPDDGPNGDEDNSFTYTSYGALVELHDPIDDPEAVKISYPSKQSGPIVVIGTPQRIPLDQIIVEPQEPVFPDPVAEE